MNYVSIICEVSAFIFSLLFYNRYKNSILKWCLPFLLFICIVEITGYYLRSVLHHNNAGLYSFSVPIEYTFYLFMFYQFLKNGILKRLLFLFEGIIITVSALYISTHPLSQFNPMLMPLGNIIMIITCCFYFWELFNAEQERGLFEIPFFWLSSGIFLLNLGELSYSLFSKIMMESLDIYSNFLRLLLAILSVILFSAFIKTLSFPKSAYAEGTHF